MKKLILHFGAKEHKYRGACPDVLIIQGIESIDKLKKFNPKLAKEAVLLQSLGTVLRFDRTCRETKSSGQSKKASLTEQLISTCIGYIVACSSQMVLFPLFGLEVAFTDHLLLGLFFTIVSIIRGYYVRRLFNWLHTRGILK